MRSDMKKVVVERPRWGSRLRNQKFGARLQYIPDHDYDEQPKKARGFESFHNGWGKSFTDVLGPLERFLRSNLNRPWDKIYSELSSGLDKRKTTGQHIFDHVKHMVETNCYVGDDGKLYSIHYGEQEVRGFYVHPRTRLLRETKHETTRQRRREELLAREVTRFNLDGNMAYQKHEGIWYKVKLMRMVVKFDDPITLVYDIFLKRKVRLNWGENWVTVEKKQCSRRELEHINRLREGRERRIRSM